MEYGDLQGVMKLHKLDRALKTLNSLLATSPRNVQALELKALTLKTQGKNKEAAEIYQKLIEIKAPKDRAPYNFELGMIDYEAKNYGQAKPALKSAIAGGFNVGAGNFFLGLIAFADSDMPTAVEHFTEVTTDPGVGSDLKTAAHYYLGMAELKTGYGTDATHEFIATMDTAKEDPNNSKITADVATAAKKALEPYDHAQWFGSFSLL